MQAYQVFTDGPPSRLIWPTTHKMYDQDKIMVDPLKTYVLPWMSIKDDRKESKRMVMYRWKGVVVGDGQHWSSFWAESELGTPAGEQTYDAMSMSYNGMILGGFNLTKFWVPDLNSFDCDCYWFSTTHRNTQSADARESEVLDAELRELRDEISICFDKQKSAVKTDVQSLDPMKYSLHLKD